MITPSPSLLHSIPLIAASVVAATGETAVIAATTGILFMALPAITAAARWRIWIGVFVSAMLLPLVSALHLPALHRTSDFAASADAPFHVDSAWAVGLLSVWALLFIYRGAHLLRSAMLLHRLARRATPIMVNEEFSALLKAESKGRVRRAVKLCSSNDVDVPSIVGFFEPRILLPTTLLEKMSPLDLRQIVLHEMEHLRRKDDWTNLLQKIGLVLLPINPVLFWVERRLCIERELACDDGVLRATGAGKAYATCLANLAEHSLLRRSMTLALGAWQRQSELTRRVRRVLRAPQQRLDPRRAVLSAATAMAVVIVSTFLLARAPQFIAFGPDAPSQFTPALSSTRESAHVFRTMAAPHIEMVSAVMNRTQPSPPRRKLSSSRHGISQSMATHATRSESWMVLTDWREVGSVPRLTLAVSEDSQFTYAAIPMRDGWLVVQL
jgi:beta-lactamase regulating signal transducer with metallopeptidase domain